MRRLLAAAAADLRNVPVRFWLTLAAALGVEAAVLGVVLKFWWKP